MTVFQELAQKLDEKREELRMTDTQFAQLLGVSKATWSFTKNGHYLIGDKIAGAVALHFPELGLLVLRYQAEKRRLGMKVDQRLAAVGDPEHAA